jgi:hypothetical protein
MAALTDRKKIIRKVAGVQYLDRNLKPKEKG